jgi:hypothetical protein
VKIFKEKVRRKKIGIKVDNQVALAYINKMTKKVPKLAKIARKIIKIAESIGTTVTTMYIPSKENKKANSISKLKNFYN